MNVIIAFILGSASGVILMCLVQINRDKNKDKQIKELKDEIEMQELNGCNLGGYCLQDGCTHNWKECEYLDKEELQ